MYLAGLVFLDSDRFIGTKVYGARSWLHLGPINFQPAQLAVVAGIMVLALVSEPVPADASDAAFAALRRDRRARRVCSS